MFKGFNTLLFLIILMAGIVIIPGAVSAAADGGQVYVSTHGDDSWDGLSATFNNSTNSGPKATITNATGIVATNGTVYVASGTYNENQINITKSMRIVGENRDNTIINGTNSGFIFNIPSGTYVTLVNLTLTRGQNDNGGAIVNNGTLTIRDSQFTSNNATTNGGAIYNYGTSTITNSTFFNNVASGQGNSEGDGGAILNRGVMAIDGSTFSGNIGYRGGAIENNAYPDDVYLTVTNSAFINNSANNGGAISSMSSINGGRVYLTFINNSFINNTATRYGGAIYGNVGNFGSFNFNRFTENTALSNNANIIYMSGNIDARYNWWGSNSPNSDHTDFDVNVDNFSYDPWIVLTITVSPASVKSGGVSNVTADLLHDNHGYLHNPAQGAVPYNGSANFTADGGSIADAFFVDGEARTTLHTGGVHGLVNVLTTVDGETVKKGVYVGIAIVNPVDGSIVHRNQNITVTFSEPIVVGPGYNDIRVTDRNGNQRNFTITFNDNILIISPVGLWDSGVLTFVLPGDAVTNAAGDLLTLSLNSTFIVESNTIYVSKSGNDSWDGLTPATAKLTIKNAIRFIAANGTIHVASGTYRENQITITKNLTIIGAGRANTIINGTNSGYIFDIAKGVYFSISNLTITQGQSSTNGGAIYNEGILTLNNTALTNNTASRGGAIYNIGKLTVDNSVFTGNYASYGGAIYNYSTGTLTVNNSIFMGNSASSGGAIGNVGSASVIDSEFKNNNATYGGAINNGGTMHIIRSTFTGNTANRSSLNQGGAIQNSGVLIVDDSTFTNNIAVGSSGGAINNNPEASLTVNNSTFTNNTGGNGSYGGGISSFSGSTVVTVTNSTFIGNSVAIDGGDQNNIDNCTFIGNKGIIENDGGAMNISNSKFFNNTGTIANSFGGSLTIINTVMSGNTAGRLGLIYNSMTDGTPGEVNIINSVFTGNTGSNHLIYNFNGILRVTGSVFTNNTATSPTASYSLIRNEYGDVHLSFNQIFNNNGWLYDVSSRTSSVYADNNWWGSNDGPGNRVNINSRGVNSWLVLTISIEKSVVGIGESVVVSVNMWYNNLNEFLDPANGHVMDGLVANLMSNLGIFSDPVVSLVNGAAQAVFTATNLGSGNIVATLLGQTFSFLVQVFEGVNNSSDNTTQNNTHTNSTNSSSSSDGTSGGLSPGMGDGSPTVNNPQETDGGQTQGDTSGSVTGESEQSVGESGESSGESGQNQKAYEVTTNTTGSSGTSQPETVVVAIVGVVLLLMLVGIGYYFKK